MQSRRHRVIWFAAVFLAVAWGLAWLGHTVARNSRMTADKFRDYVQSVDLSQLSGEKRAEVLRMLADKLNALPAEERRQARLNRDWESWFRQMTDVEKETFVETTFPTGIKQMITVFEKMPEERRRRTIDEAIRRLRDAQPEGAPPMADPGGSTDRLSPPAEISPELEARIRTLGLRAFIANSSAQTKAEVAPLLEEIQRIVESGGRVGGRRR